MGRGRHGGRSGWVEFGRYLVRSRSRSSRPLKHEVVRPWSVMQHLQLNRQYLQSYLSEGDVASVGEWSDDQTGRVAQILVEISPERKKKLINMCSQRESVAQMQISSESKKSLIHTRILLPTDTRTHARRRSAKRTHASTHIRTDALMRRKC